MLAPICRVASCRRLAILTVLPIVAKASVCSEPMSPITAGPQFTPTPICTGSSPAATRSPFHAATASTMATPQRTARWASSGLWSSTPKVQHKGVADVFFEAAAVLEDDPAHAVVEIAQEFDHALGRVLLGEGGEADEIGEQHGDILPAHGTQGFVPLGEIFASCGEK